MVRCNRTRRLKQDSKPTFLNYLHSLCAIQFRVHPVSSFCPALNVWFTYPFLPYINFQALSYFSVYLSFMLAKRYRADQFLSGPNASLSSNVSTQTWKIQTTSKWSHKATDKLWQLLQNDSLPPYAYGMYPFQCSQKYFSSPLRALEHIFQTIWLFRPHCQSRTYVSRHALSAFLKQLSKILKFWCNNNMLSHAPYIYTSSAQSIRFFSLDGLSPP